MSNISTINNETYQKKFDEKEYTFNMYFYTTLFQSGFSLIKFYFFLIFCRKASLNIHEAMLKKLILAPLSFFDTNYVGNILNRCSFDVNNIDENLPFLFPQLTGVSILFIHWMHITSQYRWSTEVSSYVALFV